MRFSSFNEALLAYFHGEVELQARIKIYIPNKDIYEEPSSEGVSLVTLLLAMRYLMKNCRLKCGTSI